MLRAARHRVGQFRDALDANAHPPDPAEAGSVLPPELVELFAQMDPPDRRHTLQALALLRRAGHTDEILLQAALLHDVGKANARIGVAHRIARVLLRSALPPLWAWLSASPTGWRRPFWVVAHHPERGAVWVATRGGHEDLVELIRHHEGEAPRAWAGTVQGRRHAALAEVDAVT